MSDLLDFIIVGAPRSGTTYLARNLASHPSIFVGGPRSLHSTGDVHFFDVKRWEGRENHSKGLEWYKALFADAERTQVKGEKTADYLADPRAPYLIRKSVGRAKIIAVLRDPVERAYSHYWHEHHRVKGVEFEEIVHSYGDVGDAWILSSGYYATNLKRYFSLFGRDAVHVVIFEDMMNRPEIALKEVCDFLEVDSQYEFPYINSKINRGSRSRLVTSIKRCTGLLQQNAPRIYSILANSIIAAPVSKVLAKKRGVGDVGKGVADRADTGYPKIDERVGEKLRAHYRKEVQDISGLLGRDLEKLWWG